MSFCLLSCWLRLSPSARKVWIEITLPLISLICPPCHLPQGRCGLKLVWNDAKRIIHLVTFRKEGVDWNHITSNQSHMSSLSPSARKVWIEIGLEWCQAHHTSGHLPQGRCGLKLSQIHTGIELIASPSARKVWIEIVRLLSSTLIAYVTFRKEGVDWNGKVNPAIMGTGVTFRKEGVDWNSALCDWNTSSTVSPSARKVWIEIL